ncbi:DUF835 domain-containing protein [Thermococcus pacificus]|uniref:DUF835 domain-containing protein n=1 Tax=Thermococcus pacificus TaxID=71998 RepID=A0A218P5X2_9EURY|nr:DUF835 domain-containing protein [Thermococcus pacificus]ASJ06182.1 hypothetical protein A3L08_01970 [Thermococcus pacificus]
MELTVPWYILVYDVVLLVGMGYIWWFFLKRWNRYVAELRPFIRSAAVFIGFAFVGRLLDLITDFYPLPYQDAAFAVLYGVSILGVIYAMINYVLLLERSYIPPKTVEFKPNPSGLMGAYVLLGGREKLVEIVKIIREHGMPALIFTRSPHFYAGLGELVTTVWVTQATDAGVPPTKLHVIQETAIQFAKEVKGSVIVIDCVEYLLLYNDFKTVFKFLTNLRDHIVLKYGSGLILFIDNAVLSEREKALLLKEFEPI